MSRRVRLLPIVTFVAVLLLPAASALAANCSDFSSQLSAQNYYDAQAGDPDGLDRDNDGWACESNGAPKASAPKGSTAAAPVPQAPALAPQVPAAPAPMAAPVPAATEPVKKATATRARVISVVDGDTIQVRTANRRRITVRLIGIDTPETKKPGVAVECGGRQATAAMKNLVMTRRGGRAVTLTSDPTQDTTDRYGRALSYVNIASGGTDVARAMVKAGWASVYVFKSPFARLATFDSAQSAAKSARRGAWSSCGGNFHSRQ